MKKKSIFLAIAVTGVVIISYATNNQDKQSLAKQSPIVEKLQSIAPQLVSDAGTTNKLPPDTKGNSKHEPIDGLQQKLIGKITNPFGIRDDILDFILKTISADDIKTTIAAIKLAQYDQKQIGVTDDKALNQYSNKGAAAIYCMNLSIRKSNEFVEGYDKLLRNTPERLTEQNRIEHLLNGHVISADFGIDTYDHELQCKHLLGMDK